MKILVFVVAFVVFLSMCPPTYAHVQGISILKVNGVDALIHPASQFRQNIFNLPPDSDIAPQAYLVNKKVEFELDTTKFITPQEIFKKTIIMWDFGDGTPVEKIKFGTKNSHMYKKNGSYILKISADYAPAGFKTIGEQLLQTTIVHIVPEVEYKLPVAKIIVNRETKEQGQSIGVNLLKKITFDASNSISSSKIIAYEWDFGDGTTSNQAIIEHLYNSLEKAPVPLLRIRDEKGLISDEFVLLEHQEDAKNFEGDASFGRGLFIVSIQVILLIVIAFVGIWYFLKRKNRVRNK